MGYDWTITDGETAPAFDDTLTLEDGTVPNFVGATVELVLRSLTSAAPLTLAGTVAFTGVSSGTVQFSPVTSDTQGRAGTYAGRWRVTFGDGRVMSFPTVGVLSVLIDENPLTAVGGQLVTVPDVKEYLNIPAGDRTRDSELARYIAAARPVVENITGPIIVAEHTEWHAGGHRWIIPRRQPSTTYGTTPVLTLTSATEYTGSTGRALTIIDDPSEGSSYSCLLDDSGTITRRTGGGGITAFMGDTQIVYSAGQSTVPANVYEGTLELIRVNFRSTRAAGIGRRAQADELDTGAPLGFFCPRRVREMLAPNRRAPAVG